MVDFRNNVNAFTTTGAVTGKGYHVGIIDDPVKGAEAAASETLQKRNWEWYQSEFLTREEPEDGAIVIVLTRWHEADLAAVRACPPVRPDPQDLLGALAGSSDRPTASWPGSPAAAATSRRRCVFCRKPIVF